MPDAFRVPSVVAPSSERDRSPGWMLLLAGSALIASIATAQAHSPFGKIDNSFSSSAQVLLTRAAAVAPFRLGVSCRTFRLEASQLTFASDFAESLRTMLAY